MDLLPLQSVYSGLSVSMATVNTLQMEFVWNQCTPSPILSNISGLHEVPNTAEGSCLSVLLRERAILFLSISVPGWGTRGSQGLM